MPLRLRFQIGKYIMKDKKFTELDGLQAKVNALRGLQSKTQEELDALLPSVLDKAFKGEL